MLRNSSFNTHEKSLFLMLSNTTNLYYCLQRIIIEYLKNETEYDRTFFSALTHSIGDDFQNSFPLIIEYSKDLRKDQKTMLKSFLRNEYTLLIAPSGSGKTTLLNYIPELNHPVIKLDFNDIVSKTFEATYSLFKNILVNEAKRYNIALEIKDNGTQYDLVSVFETLIDELNKMSQKKVCITIDNYDAPLFASYYYYFYPSMRRWLQYILLELDDLNCNLILAGLAYHERFLRNKEVVIADFLNNSENIFFPFKEISTLSGAWIPHLIKKNTYLVSELNEENPLVYTFSSADIYTGLALDKITTDDAHFIKLLIHLGYFTFVQQLNSGPYDYALYPHPDLLKIVNEPLPEEKLPAITKKKYFLFHKKPSIKLPTTPYQTHSFWYSTLIKTMELNRKDMIILLDLELLFSDYAKPYQHDNQDIQSHPRINKDFDSISNRYFLWQMLFRHNDKMSHHIINLCIKYSAKIILFSSNNEFKSTDEQTNRIFSLSPLAPHIIKTIICRNDKRLDEEIETSLLQKNKQLKSFIILCNSTNYFFSERSIQWNSDQTYEKYFKTANQLLAKSLSHTVAPELSHWNAFCNGKLKLAFFDLNQLRYLKLYLGLNSEALQTALFTFLPTNPKLKSLTLNHFLPQTFLTDLTAALKMMKPLKYLCISHNSLNCVNILLTVLDGEKYHIPEIDFSHNSLSNEGQALLAEWLVNYPMPIKIYFNNSSKFDNCILKAIHKNPHIQFFSDVLFQPIFTPMQSLPEITQKMMAQERFIYSSDQKAHNMFSFTR